MDRFCIDRGTLLDNPSIRTLEQPELHSYHCLLDVRACTRSGYEILVDPINPGDLYTHGVALDEDGTTRLIELARSRGDPGSCTTCSGEEGNERNGFRITAIGTLKDLGSSDAPPTITLNEVDVQAQGCSNQTGIFNDFSEMMVDVTIPESTLSGTRSFARIAYIHGILMIVGWGILIPSGAIIAKFMRHKDPTWFHLHMRCTILGLLLALIGFVLALTQFDAFGQIGFTAYNHAVIGVIVMVLGMFQPINAALRPHLPKGNNEDKSNNRVIWEYIHKSSGLCAILLAIIAIGLGTTLLPANHMAFQIAYPIVAATTFLSLIFFSRYDAKTITEN